MRCERRSDSDVSIADDLDEVSGAYHARGGAAYFLDGTGGLSIIHWSPMPRLTLKANERHI